MHHRGELQTPHHDIVQNRIRFHADTPNRPVGEVVLLPAKSRS
jgi:hypothetical protein